MNKEQIILTRVEATELEIDAEGRIWRLKKRHGKPRQKGERAYQKGIRTLDCRRVRAEYSTRDGYLLVTVTIDGVKAVSGAHRVVWTHFNGPIPEGLTINHKDGLKSRNAPDNLELATYSEQRYHAINVLGAKHWDCRGSNHPRTKLTEGDVLRMRQMRKDGAMVKMIAAAYGMKYRAVSAICTGRTWAHV